jgi:hypothetical protein
MPIYLILHDIAQSVKIFTEQYAMAIGSLVQYVVSRLRGTQYSTAHPQSIYLVLSPTVPKGNCEYGITRCIGAPTELHYGNQLTESVRDCEPVGEEAREVEAGGDGHEAIP